MPDSERRNEERIKEEKEFKKQVYEFISESRTYRATDAIMQEAIKKQVDKTNGRVTTIEDRQDATEKWQAEIENKIKERKEQLAHDAGSKKAFKDNIILLISITTTVIMTVATIVMACKKGG